MFIKHLLANSLSILLAKYVLLVPLQHVPNSIQPKALHLTHNVLPEENANDTNNLSPLPQQYIYHHYSVIPYHNQPIYQNIVCQGPADITLHVNHYSQHAQVRTSSVDNNYIDNSNNTVEYANVQHSDRHIAEENISQSINKNEIAAVNTSKNYVHENGECHVVNDKKDEEKEIVESKPVSKSWASLFSDKSNQTVHNNHEVNGKLNESLNDSGIKAQADVDAKLPEAENSLKNNYDDPIYYRLGGEFLNID